MAFVETPQDLNDDEAAIAPIEVLLAASLVNIFRDMADAYFQRYVATGQVLDTSPFEPRIGADLRASYNAVNQAVGGDIARHIVDNPTDNISRSITILAEQRGVTTTQQIDQLIEDTLEALDDAYTRRLSTTLPKITETTNEQFERYTANATGAADDLTPRPAIAGQAAQEFEDNIPWRTNTIADQETGAIARNIKQVEVDTLGGTIAPLEAQGLVTPLFMKEWVTRGDDLVRPAHVDADSQLKPSDQPFEVMGELLMYPRDYSLGASFENTMNCRCDSVRNLDVLLD